MDWNSATLQNFIRQALQEDIGTGDVTSLATVPATAEGRARILARAPMVCAGLPIVESLFRVLDPAMDFEFLAQDGDVVESERDLVRFRGRARAILTGERAALNFLSHLSGVATLTRRFVEQLAGTRAKIRDTRKTTPGMRQFEKYAVKMGGGTNHRMGLFDAILLKENHITLAGGVKAAMDKAHAYASSQATPREMNAYESTGASPNTENNSLPIQIEVRNEQELREALGAGAEAILLDNMSPKEAARAVSVARGIRPDCVIEISGGITLQNVRAYAECGADYLSSGTLTHSAAAANLSLLVDSIEDK